MSVSSGELEFWRAALAGLPEVLALPADRPRPAVRGDRGGSAGFSLGAEVHGRLRELGRDCGATLFMVVHAGLAVLLSRLGAGRDIAVGVPVAGRRDEALDDLVGFFVNTLVLRAQVPGDLGFRELLGRVRDGDLAAFAHQDVPFERVVEAVNPVRSSSHNPLFQVMLTVESGDGADLALGRSRAVAEPARAVTAKLDLAFALREKTAPDGGPGGIAGHIDYAADLFDEATVRALGRRLVRVLEAVAADPGVRAGQIDILDGGERDAVLRQ